MELPPNITQKLGVLAQKSKLPIEQLTKEYNEFFLDDFIQKDSTFNNDDDRHHYCLQHINSKYLYRMPVKPVDIVPIGISSVRLTKSNVPRASVFCLDSKQKIRRISFLGEETCKQIPNISIWFLYKGIMLSEFKGGDLSADDRAKFTQSSRIDATPAQLIEALGFPHVTISDAGKNLSATDSQGYAIETDWKVLRGYVQRISHGKNDDGTEWTSLIVNDDTCADLEPEISPSGEILPPGFTIFISKDLVNFDENSEMFFIGTITKSKKKNGKLSMNCFSVLPIHVVREK